MDPSGQYQQQTASQTLDPSQIQPHDQSTQAYYAYYHQYQQYYQQQQYPYYTQDYTNAYQQEPSSIHPPGVPIPPETTHVVGSEQGFGSYYPDPQQLQQFNSSDSVQQWQGNHGGFGHVPMHGGSRPPIGQSAYRGGGRRGGRPFRGGGRGRGHLGRRPDDSGPTSHGRGGGHPPTSAPGPRHPAPIWPPPRMAWCELCRVDCTTPEILEQHKNGKRHKKNLQVYEEFQTLNKLIVKRQNEQNPSSEIKLEEEKKPPEENLPSQAATDEKNTVETEQKKLVSGEEESTEEPSQKPRMDHFGGRGQKRKMRGGRGSNKWMRNYEGPRRPVEPPKPKEIVPLICELCNVKCESPIVFDSHLTGKKHLTNLKRFQGHQAMLGQATLQALYPALQALYPALQALTQPNPNSSTSFDPQFHQQGIHGPQPGSSMVPPAEASAPVLDLETRDRDSELQGLTSGDGPQNGIIQQQPVTVHFETEQAENVNVKSENGNAESGKEEVDPPVDNSI